MNPDLIRHLQGENIGRFPVWMMRQAGRYLPQYREIREKHSFWEMVTTPELASEVSLQPRDEAPVDAIIFFSDILTLPYGLGIDVELKESVGPVLDKPLRTIDAFQSFSRFDPKAHTPYVGKALTQIRERLASETTLIGFAGAPWTVATYLIEGKPSKEFVHIKKWMYDNPEELVSALTQLAEATIKYARFQVESGAQMIQLFDTWLSEMPRTFFQEYYFDVLNQTFSELRKLNVPLVYFSKKTHHLLEDFKALPIDVLSVDASLSLTEFDKRTDGQFSLQGNLDSVVLLGNTSLVRAKTRALVQEAKTLRKPAILNLGHGIIRTTPVENMKAFVEEARALWI